MFSWSFDAIDPEQEDYLLHSVPQEDRNHGKQIRILRTCSSHIKLLVKLSSFLSLALIGALLFSSGRCDALLRGRKQCDTPTHGYQCQPRISHNWGQYSPFFAVPSDISPDIPDNCKITFAQVLSRHGARDPTASKTATYAKLVQKIKATATEYKGDYAFLKGYAYTLGADQLTPFGEQQMVNSGIEFFNRYKSLAKSFPLFVRAASEDRVVVSAQKFNEGYHQARIAATGADPVPYPYDIVIISEEADQNNTLNHGLCTAFETLAPYIATGSSAQNTYQDTFLSPLIARINANLPPLNFTASETISFLDLCPFNTVASPTGDISSFCGLFTFAEWKQYSYFQSLGKFYGYGPGNALGPTNGVGFTNELIARLTGTVVIDNTSVNHTLDDSPVTFPVGAGYPLFADFTHDNDLTAIFAALGLFDNNLPLSNTTLQSAKQSDGYSAAWTVPFAARAYFEKMECRGDRTTEELVRVVVNGRVVPLQGCGADSKGRCRLSDFVLSQGFAKSGGRWADC